MTFWLMGDSGMGPSNMSGLSPLDPLIPPPPVTPTRNQLQNPFKLISKKIYLFLHM